MLSVDGLASGLDTSGLIEQLLSIQRRPIFLLQDQVATANQRQTAFLDITARVLSLKSSVSKLADPETFNSVSATSSAESVLAASASTGVPPGVYSFRVGQLASPSQYASNGFANSDVTSVGAGSLSLEYGGFIDVATELDELNGGSGVTRGKFRITDGDGNTATIDVGAAVSVRDVVSAINEAPGINITASVADETHSNTGRGLVLTDSSIGGVGGPGNIVVEEVGGTDTAADLGILASAAGTIEGGAIRTIGMSTRLATLMDGLGARGGAGDDIEINATALAGPITIDIDALSTVQDLKTAVEQHANNTGQDVSVGINAAGDGLEISSAAGGMTIVDIGAGSAATDLGIAEASATSSVTGATVLSGIDDMFLSTLNGGSGVATLGSISIQDRASGSGVAVDLSGAETIQDVIRAINASPANVAADLNDQGNGFRIRDNSGGSGDLIVGDVGASTAAADLGILGTGDGNVLSGTDVDPRYIHENTLLSSLNGGRGVSLGSIRITSTSGATATVNVSNSETIGDVITNIKGQAGSLGVLVGFNEAGNGLLITDPSGLGTLRIDEVDGGSTARDLHLLGSADAGTPNVIDGAFEEVVTIGATDTLQDVLQAIDALNINVTAAILNDGSAAGHRLSVIGDQSGRAGRLQVGGSGGTSLDFNRTSEARDGILFYGETSSSSESIMLRSSSNTYEDVIQGLTVSALTTSVEPVRVTVNRSFDNLKDRVAKFVEDFNGIVGSIDDLTDYNVDTEERGLLLGDGALRNTERLLFNGAIRPLSGVENSLSLLSEIGVRVQGGRLTFDSSEFDAALAEDSEGVEKLFTASRPLEERTKLSDFNNGDGVDLDTADGDFEISLRDGSTFEVDIDGAVYAEDIVAAINDAATAAGASVTAALSSSGNSFVLRDASTGTSAFRVSTLNGSSAANNLGLNRSADATGGGTLTGFEIDLTDDPGVAARLIDVIDQLTDVETGTLQRRADRFDDVISNLESRIETLTERLGRRDEQLRRQFAQLEQVIQSSQGTQQRLSAQLSSLG